MKHGEYNDATLAQSVLSSDLRYALSEKYKETLRHLENDGLPHNKILLIQLAVDGLYYAQ